VLLLVGVSATALAQSESKKDDKKKKAEPLPVKKLTQGMGLYAIGPVSPDAASVILLGQKTEGSPNLYVMSLQDFSIRPPLTSLQWGVADPQWSPDGSAIAFAGFGETATFSDLYVVDVKTGRTRQLTRNNFSDKEPVFSPDGKRVLFTTDESPLPEAAFGILHIASVPAAGGKSEYFTEDEASTIRACISSDGRSVLLVKVDETSGRHSLWEYRLDGKQQRDLTERRFARIHKYIPVGANGTIVIWAQEEAEQQDDIYVLDVKTRQIRELAEPDLPKRNPAVSPNGALIAFTGPGATGTQLYLYDVATGQIQQLTVKGTNSHSPVFIANDKLLFASNRDGDKELYLLDLAPPPPEEKKKK
jgi:Tol biopolymer transport system component